MSGIMFKLVLSSFIFSPSNAHNISLVMQISEDRTNRRDLTSRPEVSGPRQTTICGKEAKNSLIRWLDGILSTPKNFSH